MGYRTGQDWRDDLFLIGTIRRLLARWRSRGQRSSAIPRTSCCPIALTPCRFGAWKIECSRLPAIAQGSEARGGKDQLTFIGNSEVVAPRGAILHRAPRDQEELCIVEIDPADARNKALTPYNDLLRDRRRIPLSLAGRCNRLPASFALRFEAAYVERRFALPLVSALLDAARLTVLRG